MILQYLQNKDIIHIVYYFALPDSLYKFFAILLIVKGMFFELDAILLWMACTFKIVLFQFVHLKYHTEKEHQTENVLLRSFKYLT